MMEQESLDQEYQYLIPKNVNTRFTFFTGFGWFELFLVIGGVIFGVCIFSLLSIVTNSLWRIFAVIIPPLFMFLLTQQDKKTGVSLLSLISDYKKFSSSIKRYVYIYGEGRKCV